METGRRLDRLPIEAPVAELADAPALDAGVLSGTYGFESHHGAHHFAMIINARTNWMNRGGIRR
jgi:hypothetical protein